MITAPTGTSPTSRALRAGRSPAHRRFVDRLAHPLRFLSRRILAANTAALRSPHAGRAVFDTAPSVPALLAGRARHQGGRARHQRGPELTALAARLPPRLHLGTSSSWSYPGWDGIVWSGGTAKPPPRARRPRCLYAPSAAWLRQHRPFVLPARSPARSTRPTRRRCRSRSFVVKVPAAVSDAVLRDERARRSRTRSSWS